jgi:RimJ/RimL family protein N-acetyltransferase
MQVGVFDERLGAGSLVRDRRALGIVLVVRREICSGDVASTVTFEAEFGVDNASNVAVNARFPIGCHRSLRRRAVSCDPVALVVREAEDAQIGDACALWRLAESARTGIPADPAAVEAQDFAAALTEAAAKPGARLLVGTLDGRLVATIYGVPLRADPTCAQVAMLAVTPELWGQGIGTQTLDALTTQLRRQGCLRLRMNVDAANHRARDLYERNGWRHTGETERVEEVTEPELVYRLDLAQWLPHLDSNQKPTD